MKKIAFSANKMKKIFNILFLVINILFIGLFLISGMASYINPSNLSFPSSVSLFFLPLLLINVVFLLFWAMRMKWYLLFPLIAIACMWSNLYTYLPIHTASANQIEKTPSTISILSYNVKLFDFYKKNKSTENYHEIIQYIIELDADIVCLQEFGYYNSSDFLSEKDILNALQGKYPYHHIKYHLNSNGKSTYGVATFSQYPIAEKGEIDYGSTFNHTIYSDIRINDKTLRLFNCHLESNRLTFNDKRKMAELIDSTSQEKIQQTTSQLGKKLGAASKKRALQADSVAANIARSPYPIIVCRITATAQGVFCESFCAACCFSAVCTPFFPAS